VASDRIERLAKLIVEFGANVQRGQLVDLGANVGNEELARAVAAAAYERGAKFVDVSYYDPHVKHARIARVEDEFLEYIPPWFGQRVLELGREHAASIFLSGPSAPGLFDDLDPKRVGRDTYPRVKEWMTVIDDNTVNWSISPCPNQAWAKLVHPDLDDGAAFEKLWDEITHICRLDEADPPAAWRERSAQLKSAAKALNDRHFDALHFEGDGTDLTVGLLETSSFHGGGDKTVDGIDFLPNLPTEEVFTAPDPKRVDGTVRATKPLIAYDAEITGLCVRFEGGRAVDIDADKGADTMRGFASRDEGAARLGEVSLVDKEGRIGAMDTVFYDILIDENAASHIAIGDAYKHTVDEPDFANINRSEIHLDFMIGGPGVDVTGLTKDGERVPVLRDGVWAI
jgi:aminopeptidase